MIKMGDDDVTQSKVSCSLSSEQMQKLVIKELNFLFARMDYKLDKIFHALGETPWEQVFEMDGVKINE